MLTQQLVVAALAVIDHLYLENHLAVGRLLSLLFLRYLVLHILLLLVAAAHHKHLLPLVMMVLHHLLEVSLL